MVWQKREGEEERRKPERLVDEFNAIEQQLDEHVDGFRLF